MDQVREGRKDGSSEGREGRMDQVRGGKEGWIK